MPERKSTRMGQVQEAAEEQTLQRLLMKLETCIVKQGHPGVIRVSTQMHVEIMPIDIPWGSR